MFQSACPVTASATRWAPLYFSTEFPFVGIRFWLADYVDDDVLEGWSIGVLGVFLTEMSR